LDISKKKCTFAFAKCEEMKKSILSVFFCAVFALYTWAVEVHIADPKMWNSSALSAYVGQTVTFDVPMYTVGSSSKYVSPCCVTTYDSPNSVYISGAPGSTRPRVYSKDLSAKVVKSTSGDGYYLQYKGGTFDGNTRTTLEKGPDWTQIDAKDEHTLLVCAANLEYYLVKNLGTGYGPDNEKQHAAQRTKTKQALALINADLYGFCEVEQGTTALHEICTDLNTAHPNRRYVYVDNKTSSAAGSYTMSGFVYDSLTVRAIGKCQEINTEVQNRKYMQCFQEKSTKETFIFSMNHFKAMSGGGDTESRRIAEANAINANYETYKVYSGEEDLLIMGDLNCHYGSQPISILLMDGARTDLHRYFHPEGSYSYLYGNEANYLDHAICNSTMLPQVTGMQAFHVNSDENDCYTYDGYCNDGTMFRYSDHDPILVGLRLNDHVTNDLIILNYGPNLTIQNAEGGFVRIYDLSGNLLYSKTIDRAGYGILPEEEIPAMTHGCYVVHVYFNGKNNITKYIRP